MHLLRNRFVNMYYFKLIITLVIFLFDLQTTFLYFVLNVLCYKSLERTCDNDTKHAPRVLVWI